MEGSKMLILRKAEFKPNTYDAATNTIEVVWATQTPVQRRDSAGVFNEVLSLDPAHVDLSRLQGASVLNSHSQANMSDIVGVVVSASVRDGMGFATVKLSSRPDMAPYIQDIIDGIIRFLSVGYSVTKFAESKNAKGERTKTATHWQPFEISFVPVPADPNSTVRTQTMEPIIEIVKPNIPDVGVLAHRALIRDTAKISGLDSNWADRMIDSGAAIETVKSAAHDELVARSRTQNIQVRQVGPSSDDPAVILSRRMDALAAKVTGGTVPEAARGYASLGLKAHARAMLEASGTKFTGTDDELIKRAAMHTTGDFPALLSGVGSRILMPAYIAAQSPAKTLFRKASHDDFRPNNKLRISELGLMDKLSETGEIKGKSRTEITQGYALETYANQMSISRKALINDDLSALRDSASAWGVAAAQTEAKILVALLESNAATYDGVAMFHATHGNLGVAGPTIGSDELSAARTAIRMQKGLDGVTPLNLAPKYLVIPAILETDAETVLTSINPTALSEVNVFSGKLELLVDSRLTGDSYYVFADTAAVPCFEYAVLSGNEGPTIETESMFDQLGISTRCYFDFAAANLDWRGAYKMGG
jgi:Mu-like prophage major head subunit gpT